MRLELNCLFPSFRTGTNISSMDASLLNSTDMHMGGNKKDSGMSGMGPMDQEPMSGMGPMDQESMQTYFNTEIKVYVLFEPFKITSLAQMIGACIVIFLLALLYECWKAFRTWVMAKYAKRRVYELGNRTINVEQKDSSWSHMRTMCHFLQAILHMIQFVWGYLLMLVFMTYNVWLCLAMTIGAGFGYYFFAWYKPPILKHTIPT